MSNYEQPCQPCPPCNPCEPPPSSRCVQPPPPPECLGKPMLRGIHWTYCSASIRNALGLSIFAGLMFNFFVKNVRYQKYKDYYAKTDVDELEDDMAKKGYFQAVPIE